MTDKFRSLTLKQAIAVQIFYTSPDDENLVGKTLNGESWVEPLEVVTNLIFRKTGTEKDETLEKLIRTKSYKKIIEQYDKHGATYKMVITYKDVKNKLKEMNLTKAIKLALSPEELPGQIIKFLLEKKEYSFLKD